MYHRGGKEENEEKKRRRGRRGRRERLRENGDTSIYLFMRKRNYALSPLPRERRIKKIKKKKNHLWHFFFFFC
jgi:hypothetical protein